MSIAMPAQKSTCMATRSPREVSTSTVPVAIPGTLMRRAEHRRRADDADGDGDPECRHGERPTVEQGAPTLLQAQLACHDDGEGHQADRDGDQRVDGTVGDRLEGREAVDQTAERERGQGDGERRARSGGALPGVL